MSDEHRKQVEEFLWKKCSIVPQMTIVDAMLAYADERVAAERVRIYEKAALISDAEYDRMKRIDCASGMESHKAVAEQLRRLGNDIERSAPK